MTNVQENVHRTAEKQLCHIIQTASCRVRVKDGKAVPVHTRKEYGGVEVQIHPFLTSALHKVRVQLLALPTIPTGKSPNSPMNRRLCQPQTQSVHFGDISFPCWELNHKSPVVQPTDVTKTTTLSHRD
jgi:hypothetical protein